MHISKVKNHNALRPAIVGAQLMVRNRELFMPDLLYFLLFSAALPLLLAQPGTSIQHFSQYFRMLEVWVRVKALSTKVLVDGLRDYVYSPSTKSLIATEHVTQIASVINERRTPNHGGDLGQRLGHGG